MKMSRNGIAGILLLCQTIGAFSQGTFSNFNFESTTIAPVYFPWGDLHVATLSGWGFSTYNTVNGDPDTVPFNTYNLDAPLVSLEGRDAPVNVIEGRSFPAIEGNYSVLLYGGWASGTDILGATISQTRQIPLGSHSVTYWAETYWGAPIQVTFNGKPLAVVSISDGPSSSVWAADLSGYAGQSGEFRFTAPYESLSMIDNIQFSVLSVPEPSTFVLLILGGLLGCAARVIVTMIVPILYTVAEPEHSADESQPFRSLSNRSPLAAGSHR